MRKVNSVNAEEQWAAWNAHGYRSDRLGSDRWLFRKMNEKSIENTNGQTRDGQTGYGILLPEEIRNKKYGIRNKKGKYSKRGGTMGGMERPTDLGLTASGLTDGCLEKG